MISSHLIHLRQLYGLKLYLRYTVRIYIHTNSILGSCGHEDTLEVCLYRQTGQVDVSEQLSFHLRQLYGLSTHSGNPN